MTINAPKTQVEVEILNDRLAREYPINDYYSISPWLIRWIEGKRLRIIREMVGEVPGATLLEIGSGGGHVLKMFPRCRLTAVDVSDVYLETARRNLTGYNVTFLKGEIEHLKLPAVSFDRIICTEVLEHTVSPDLILGEIARLLKPTGRAVITVPNDPLINSLKNIVRYTPMGWVFRDRIQWGGDHYHLHVWQPKEFRMLLSRHLEIMEQRAAPFDWLPLRVCFLCQLRTVARLP
jgi:ubiquinone/menaquinone biosynthesis C-methylase UbiE